MESRTQNTFEQATGVTLPPDYRAFLNDYAGGAALGDKDLVYSLATAQTLLSPYPFDHPRIERPLHRAHVVYLGRLRDAGVLVYEGAGAEHPTPPERFDGMVTIGFAESPDAWETGGAPSHVVVIDPETGAVLLVPIEPPGVVHRVGASFEAWLKKVSRKPRAKAAAPRKTAGVRKAAAKKLADAKPAVKKTATKKTTTPRKRVAKPATATEIGPQPIVTPEVAEQPTVTLGATAEAAPAKVTKRKSTAKKPTTKKTTAKKAATAKKTTARKKPVAKKPAAKKATAKKAAAPRKRTTKAKAAPAPTSPPTEGTPSPDRQAA